MKIQSPFGPKIGIVKIPKYIISKINKEVDSILNNTSRSKKSDYSKKLVGEVKQELEISKFFINKYLSKFLKKNIKKFIKKSSNKNLKNFKVKNFWVVRQFKNEYNPIHYHTGDISGVGYLKVPKNMGETLQQSKKVNHNGKLILIDGSKKLFCSPTYAITPQVGDFYLFPSYLMHTVYPFSNTEEERRSVSFNAKIDEAASML